MDLSSFAPLAVALLGAGITFYLASLLIHYLTEVTKGGSRIVAKLPVLSWARIRGLGSVVTALVISFASVAGPSGSSDSLTEVFNSLGVTIDGKLVTVFAGLLGWIISSRMHDSKQLPEVLPPSG